jgi:hypothetical protein
MGTVLASAIIDAAGRQLFDIDNIRWPRTELLLYINDAQRQIVTMCPEANATTTNLALAAGSKQTMPSDAWVLLDVVRNMGSGATAGRSIKKVDRHTLDETNSTWAADTATAVVTSYIYDLRDRTKFYVYPPSTGSTLYVEIIYAKNPVTLAEGDAITVNDNYVPALLDYVLFRAYSKNAVYGDPARAASFLQAFQMIINGATQTTSKLVGQMDQPQAPALQTPGSGGGG